MADAIFISYRRDDSEGEAGRLFDDLTRAFGSDSVFMDVAGIKPGVDFRRAIEQNVASCGVLLAIIGPRWLDTTNADGTRRLDDPNDFVALEIASAMKRDVPVIPVLVHEATMPVVDKLPATIKDLAFHNSVELSHARWNSDVGLLIEALKAYVTPSVSSHQEPAAPVHATVPVQLPAPHPPVEALRPTSNASKAPMISGIAIVVIVVAGLGAYFAMRPSPSPAPVVNASANPAVVPPTQASAAVPQPVQEKTPVSVPAAAPPGAHDAYIGTWKRNVGLGSSEALGMFVISQTGGGLMIHAYGSCQTPACDWGAQPASSDGGNVTATFSPKPSGSDTSRTAQVTTHVVPEGLDVVVQNSFEGPAGTRRNSVHTLFINAK